MEEPLIIIGNGITGITVARHVRKKNDRRILVISEETPYFYSRPALMYVYMGHMKFENMQPYENWFWDKNKIELLQARVAKLLPTKKKILLSDGREVAYDQLVIASGSKTNKFGWPGQDLKGVQGLYNRQDLELMEENTKGISRGVIVGGGLIGVEMAEMLHSRNIPVTFLVREKNYWDNILPPEESILTGRHIRQYGIDLRLESQLKEILGDESGRVRAVITDKGEEIPCQFVGLTAGVGPNIDFVKDSGIECGRGILINEVLETNIPDVYAAGDCAQFRVPKPNHPPVEQLWYTGRMQAEVLAQTICGDRKAYERGIWFNSAKFFDMEYQTYGYVPNKLRDFEDTLYWEKDFHAVRIVFDKTTKVVTGFNLFGIRYRLEVCEKWIKEARTIEFVLENLGQANFDPEFFKQFETDVVRHYNHKFGGNITMKRKKGLFV